MCICAWYYLHSGLDGPHIESTSFLRTDTSYKTHLWDKERNNLSAGKFVMTLQSGIYHCFSSVNVLGLVWNYLSKVETLWIKKHQIPFQFS